LFRDFDSLHSYLDPSTRRSIVSLASLRRFASSTREARAWRPAALSAISHDVLFRQRNEVAGFSDKEHLTAAAEWLFRAQDATTDGGVAGRYRLAEGWTSSYPETTGYIVPTLLALEGEGFRGSRDRAARCIEFLLGVQLTSGAFPAAEIAENRETPSIFNTGQILNGLTAWHRLTADPRTLAAGRRAADWMLAMQDSDGAWRKHLYGNRTYTYMAHAGCWLAELGQHLGEERYLAAARAHLDWVLGHVDRETGWINDCGFGDDPTNRTAVTHTIAYTISGVLKMAQILEHTEGLDVARRAAHAVARRLELSRWLPGMLDWRWRRAATYACLTGNAQMALIWIELHRMDGDPALLSAACKAIDLVKLSQPMESRDVGIRGGVPGSSPLWGDYIRYGYPNWAAKFFIDALLAKRDALRALTAPVKARGVPREIPANVPVSLDAARQTSARTLNVVLLTSELAQKVQQFVDAWSVWGFKPSAVILVPEKDQPVRVRLMKFVQDYGVRSLVRRSLRRFNRTSVPSPAEYSKPEISVVEYCRQHDIQLLTVETLDAPDDLVRIRALDPDLFVHAGAGIVRAATLAVPRLGTLNAHMGLLPPFRGMNVTEWSFLTGAPVGCTVHLIDPGIDTGAIIAFRPVDPSGAASVADLRGNVDTAQVALLGEVVQWCIGAGELPPLRPQKVEEGRQYFVMHPDVRGALEAILNARR